MMARHKHRSIPKSISEPVAPCSDAPSLGDALTPLDGDSVGGDKVLGDKVLGDKVVTTYYQINAAPAPPDRNRRAMLEKVWRVWVEGLLEPSLAPDMRIALSVVAQPNAVTRPFSQQVQELDQSQRPAPTDTPIIARFDQSGGALLILGAPGAGKTTLLLELTRALLLRAQTNDQHPFVTPRASLTCHFTSQ